MSNLEDLMNQLISMPEAKGLPEHFLKNILKIGVETSKISNVKWVKKMLSNAQKVHEQALIAQQAKLAKKTKLKIESVQVLSLDENKVKTREEKAKIYKEMISQLPKFENIASTFPNIKKTAFFVIKKNYGTWTFQAMSILNDTKAIHSFWAIQFAAALSKIGLHKVLQIIKANENLYEYVTKSEYFKESEIERNRIYNEIKQFEMEIINAKKERKKRLKEEKGL